MSTKHDIMKAYLEPQVLIVAGNVLNFNVSTDTPDSIAFVTEYADKYIKRYIRKAGVKAYGFAILITKAFSVNTDDLNLLAMNVAQAFGDWIDAQDKAKAYPNFGTKCKVLKIESLQNMPNMAEVNIEDGIARYMLQCKVTYYEEE